MAPESDVNLVAYVRPPEAGLCDVGGRPLTRPRRPKRVCSPRCRIARWRHARDVQRAVEVARLHAENATLRRRVGELERLGGQLKSHLWPGA